MKLKIALVTNKLPHHKYFISELYKQLDVKCIIIPNGKSNLLRLKQHLETYGLFWVFLKILSKLYSKFSKYSLSSLMRIAEQQFFSSSIQDYDNINPDIIHNVETVNSEIAIDLARKNDIDIICFLGGDIGRADFINSAKVACLNIHSGVSPFYNGSGSAAWAVCDNRPNFSGVTLMHMNERIDGGKIISHYLPDITSADNASTLFMKGIKGGVRLIVHAIKNMENGRNHGFSNIEFPIL